MNIKLPSIAPHVSGLKTGNEDQKQAVDSGSISRTFEKLLQDVNQQQFNAEAKKVELLVTENKEFPDGSLIVGSPAKAVRELSQDMIDNMTRSSKHYVTNFKKFINEMTEIK